MDAHMYVGMNVCMFASIRVHVCPYSSVAIGRRDAIDKRRRAFFEQHRPLVEGPVVAYSVHW